MRADVELKLIHDGEEWIVSNDLYTASGKTFEALDTNLIAFTPLAWIWFRDISNLAATISHPLLQPAG